MCLKNAPPVINFIDFNNGIDWYSGAKNVFRNKGKIETQKEMSSILSEAGNPY